MIEHADGSALCARLWHCGRDLRCSRHRQTALQSVEARARGVASESYRKINSDSSTSMQFKR